MLYGSEAQFREKWPNKPDAAGFYSPSYHELHCFHGPCNGRNGEAVATLAHEAAHQFQHIACERIGENAPIFLTEGLASFFEAPRFLPDGTVLPGPIPDAYLRATRRAVKAGEWIPLKTLIEMPRDSKQFVFIHYAHAWALIHWCFYGPDSKKSTRFLDWYWEKCCSGKTTASDFEDGVRAMGYTLPKLDKALQDWVTKLDPKNDPAVLLYEKTTGKKVPR
jgi:hypothetical protein